MSWPSGWRTLTPHQIAGEQKSAVVIGPFGSSLKVSDYRDEGVPLVFVRDVRAGDFSAPKRFIDESKALELRAHLVEPGEVLVTKMGDPPGDSCIYTGRRNGVITADCIRLRPTADFDARFVSLSFGSPQVRSQIERITSGVAQRKVSLGRFRHGVTLPMPPLDEQRRIVAMLDDQLSRLDGARVSIEIARRRIHSLVTAVLLDFIPDERNYPNRWQRSCVGEAGTVELGRQRHPDWHTGANMKPYLRVANVFEDRIDTADVKEMHWPDKTFSRFKLRTGDVLLNEGQTPDLLGRPAIYRGDPPDVAFTNSLLRFVPNGDVLAEFALLVFRRHMRAGRFKRESRITTNIAHLSASRLKPIEFPIPSLDEQSRIVAAAGEYFDAAKRLQDQLDVAVVQGSQLRRELLSAAFSGRLSVGRALVGSLESA